MKRREKEIKLRGTLLIFLHLGEKMGLWEIQDGPRRMM
jgi:hypothetical protein